MRLWHKDLIHVLPRQQLLGQWRECCAIAKNIHDNGTPNHILVNPVMDYPDVMFNSYTNEVYTELRNRGYSPDRHCFQKNRNGDPLDCSMEHEYLFSGWHNERYLTQCLANLEEKHDRGGISDDEWTEITSYISRRKMR